ncbi:MAG: hypothetical protein MAG795_00046 [Candidatus Woesearchaeota archaeon]|nr:hypothetical protein [Candidatus Woesearchaeota archaeon]
MIGQDIPKKVILVILVLIIIMSVLGTWIVFDESTSARIREVPKKEQASATISILKPENPPEIQKNEEDT